MLFLMKLENSRFRHQLLAPIYLWYKSLSLQGFISNNIIEALENPMDSAILQTRASMFRESVIVKEYLTVLE